MKRFAVIASALMVTMLLTLSTVLPAAADLTPASVSVELAPGECTDVMKYVNIDALPPTADVVFAFDLTGSMTDILDTSKAQAGNIMTALAATGVDIQFGVMSFMDYPDFYSSCDYAETYGSAPDGDYPYQLNQDITSNTTAVQAAINSLMLGYGQDGPESYTRVLYESAADPNLNWRPGAKRILVTLGDAIPHDCDLNEGVTTGVDSTGVDPGRDATAGTADDLDLQDDALQAMIDENVILLACHSTQWYGAYFGHWQYWAGLTGGNAYDLEASNLTTLVVDAVTEGLTSTTVTGLHLEVVENGNTDGTWATFDPAAYGEITLPAQDIEFTETICAPGDAAPGIYNFTVAAVDDSGVYYGRQLVTVTVPGDEPPPPSIPSVNEWGIITMTAVLSLAAVLMLRRRHTQQMI